MRIVLFPMIMARDMMPLTNLKMQLERYGHEVRILGNWEYYELFKFLPHLIVVPDTITMGSRRVCRFMKRKGTHVVLLHSEGLVSTYTEHLWTGDTYGDKDLEDLEIVWGEKTKEILIKHGNHPEKVYVCGNPRFDKYKWKLLGKKEFLQAHKFDSNKKFVLYATNLVWREDRDYSTSLEMHHVKDFESTKEKLERLRETTTRYFFDCTQHFKDVVFIIKLHPDDDIGIFTRYMKEYSPQNVLIYRDEMDIANLINICDLFLHWNSTTAIEAWILKKPTISMVFTDELDYYLTDASKQSVLVRDYETLVRKLEYYLNGGTTSKKFLHARRKIIRDFLYKVDGNSTRRCAELINNYIYSHTIQVKRTMTPEDMRMIFFDLGKKLMGETTILKLLSLLPLHHFNLHVPPPRPPCITEEQVENVQREIRMRRK